MDDEQQRTKPAWMPSAVDSDALRQRLRGLKELRPGGSVVPAALGSGEAPGGVPAPPFEERPELYVGAAFAGGLALAGLLRLLGR